MANLSAYTLEYVLCRTTGEPIATISDAKSRELSFRLNVPATCTITVPIFNQWLPQVIAGQARMKVLRSPTTSELAVNPAASKVLVFYGSLPAENLSLGDQEAKLVFRDPRWVWESRFLAAPAVFTATDQGLILASVINTENAKQDTYVTAPGATTGLRTITWDQGKKVADMVKELTEATGGLDLDIVPTDGYSAAFGFSKLMGIVSAALVKGGDRPNALFIYNQQDDGNGFGNITGFDITYSPIVNRATQASTDSNGVFAISTISGSVGPDLLESYDTQSDAVSATTLAQMAQGAINEHSILRPAFVLGETTYDGPQPLSDYLLGDTVRLAITRGPVQLDRTVVRVHGFDMSSDQEGNVHSTAIVVPNS